MTSKSLCLWLGEIEDALWRMVLGVFRFVLYRVPEWLYRTLLEIVGPVVIRAVRVLIVLCVWLAVLFGPVVAAAFIHVNVWGAEAAAAWVLLALAGSIWGLYRIKKRRAAAAAVVSERAPEEGFHPLAAMVQGSA